MAKKCKDCKYLLKDREHWKNLYYGYMRAFFNFKSFIKDESDRFICNCLAKSNKLSEKAERHKDGKN
jgi:hypothetical protein